MSIYFLVRFSIPSQSGDLSNDVDKVISSSIRAGKAERGECDNMAMAIMMPACGYTGSPAAFLPLVRPVVIPTAQLEKNAKRGSRPAVPPLLRWSGDGVSKFGRTVDAGLILARASQRAADDESRDDAGVLKDMELYLEDMSLEYDSVWDTKPAWCQPWTIVGSGVGVLSMSWLLFHNAIVTGGATLAIVFWWFSFLYAYPLAYSEMIAQRRKMVKDGNEDIYGRKRAD